MRAAARAGGASRDTIRRRQDGKLSKPEWPLGTPRYPFASLNLRRPRLRPIKAGSGNVRNWMPAQPVAPSIGALRKVSFNHLVGDGQKVEPEHQAERIRFVRLITIRSRRAAYRGRRQLIAL
jgi:hypothetical protein